MIVLPLLEGAVQLIVADVELVETLAVTLVGVEGDVYGVTLFDCDDADPEPAAFVAVTVNVYDVPYVNPVKVYGEEEEVCEVPSEAVIVYPVIELPLLDVGAVHDTLALVLLAEMDAETLVGATGVVYGVIELLLLEVEPVPAALVAATVNVYAVLYDKPVNKKEVEVDDVVRIIVEDVSYVAVIVYPVIDEPFVEGAVHDTVAVVLLAEILADTPVGVSGALVTVTELLLLDEEPVPAAFVAVTVNVYVAPAESPVNE